MNEKMEKKLNLEKAVESFDQKNIAVMGDLILDRTERGIKSKRKNPEDPSIPIIKASEKFYLGGAANVARNIVSLNSKCDLYGFVGTDIYGYQLWEMATKEGINIGNLVKVEHPTILKSRIFVDGNYIHRSDLGENNLEKVNLALQDEMFDKIYKNIKNYDGIILSDYDKHFFSENLTKKIILLAKKENIPVFSDVKPQNIKFFFGSSIISPNKKEAAKITKINYKPYDENPEVLKKMGKKITDIIGSEEAIITCGSDGAYIYDNGNSKMVKTNAKKVVEVTGAGDTFISTLALGKLSGLNIYDSVKLANLASGIVVEKEGTSVAKQEELLERIKEH